MESLDFFKDEGTRKLSLKQDLTAHQIAWLKDYLVRLHYVTEWD